MAVPMPFSENGVQVHFPDNNTFRLGDCPAYGAIKSQGVKEMDIGWFDLSNNTLWLVELKAFHHPANILYATKDLSNAKLIENILNDLLLKSIHTICQVTTNRAGTMNCLAQPPANNTSIRLVHLIRTIPGQDIYLNAMQDKLREQLKPFIAIFCVSSVSIISYDYALSTQILPWIV